LRLFSQFLGALLTLGCALSAPDAYARPGFGSAPTVSQNPNDRVPLAAVLRFEAPEPVTTHVQVSTIGESDRVIVFDATRPPAAGLPIVGLRADREYQFRVAIENSEGERRTWRRELRYRTPPLPSDSQEWPTIEVTRAAEGVEPGIRIVSVRRRTPGRPHLITRQERAFTENWGLLLGLDDDGEVVWYYSSPSRIAGVAPLSNGNIFFHMEDFHSVEIDLLGNVVREFFPEHRPEGPIPNATAIRGIHTLHHQPHETERGTFLAFSANPRRVENYYTSETDISAPRRTQTVMGDTVIEFDADGRVVWSWNAFDYLDVFRIGFDTVGPYWWVRGFPGALDWTHGNGVIDDPRNNSVVFSLKHQDAIISVDRSTGQIRWILGDPSDWPASLQSRLLRPVGPLRWPYHAHNPTITSRGTYLLYDNGQWGARPFTNVRPLTANEAFSRAVEFEVDEQNMTVREVWSSATNRTSDTCHAPGMGDARELPRTGNIFVVDAVCMDDSVPLTYDSQDFSRRHISETYQFGRVREYSYDTSRPLWEARLRDRYEILNWQIYGGFHTPSMYEIGTAAH